MSLVENGYITVPNTVDASTLQQQAIAAIQAAIPGWVPSENNLEVMLIEQLAAMVAEVSTVASQVPLAIFAYLGSLWGITPLPGAAAGMLSTWTMVDTQGYTVPAGTVVAYNTSGNTQVFFQTSNPFTVPAGQTQATGVPLICQVAGSAFNGLASADLTLQATLSFVSQVQSTTTSSGGADPETTTAYLNRLSDTLQLLTPRPILPADFAALAANITGVYRALAIDNLIAARSFADGVVTNASNVVTSAADAQFQTYDVGRGITGTDIPGGTTVASYVSATQITMSANATGSATETITLSDYTNQERAVTVAAVDDNGNALSTAIASALQTYLESLREVNFVVSVIGPTYSTINVSWSASCVAGANPNTVQAAVTAALTAYLSPANWGGGSQTPPVWLPSSTLYYTALLGIITANSGIDTTQPITLTFAISPGSLSTSNISLPGDAPLTQPGTISGTVST